MSIRCWVPVVLLEALAHEFGDVGNGRCDWAVMCLRAEAASVGARSARDKPRQPFVG
jgi:hypothetical protein